MIRSIKDKVQLALDTLESSYQAPENKRVLAAIDNLRRTIEVNGMVRDHDHPFLSFVPPAGLMSIENWGAETIIKDGKPTDRVLAHIKYDGVTLEEEMSQEEFERYVKKRKNLEELFWKM